MSEDEPARSQHLCESSHNTTRKTRRDLAKPDWCSLETHRLYPGFGWHPDTCCAFSRVQGRGAWGGINLLALYLYLTAIYSCLVKKKSACRRVSSRLGYVPICTLSPHTTQRTMCEGLFAMFAPAPPPMPTNRRQSRASQRFSATSSGVYRHTQVMRQGECLLS